MRSENWLGNSTGGPPSSTRRKREPAGSIMSSHSEIKSLIVVGPRYSSPLYRIISCIQFGKDSSFIPCTLSLSLSLYLSLSLSLSGILGYSLVAAVSLAPFGYDPGHLDLPGAAIAAISCGNSRAEDVTNVCGARSRHRHTLLAARESE